MAFTLRNRHDRDIEPSAAEKQLELMEHLKELRDRLLRAVAYLGIGMTAGWFLYHPFFTLLCGPVIDFLQKNGSKFIVVGLTEGFTIRMQMSVLIGAIIACPLLTFEGWGFIAPGLTREERKAVWIIAPLSVLLFWFGVYCAWWVLPMGVKWLVAQNPSQATFMPSVGQALVFLLKLYLGFGLVFQLPVILMFLGKIGIVSSSMLRTNWRQAIVAIAIIAAVVTPSGDAPTMLAMCIPMIGLYGLSILLVRFIEKKH